MKILIVEDEVKTGDYIRQGLMESGFVVDLARTGLDGHHLALTGSYDLIVLVRRQGEVLPRSLIASQVWDMNFDSDTNVIDVAIRRLCAKIDDGALYQ